MADFVQCLLGRLYTKICERKLKKSASSYHTQLVTCSDLAEDGEMVVTGLYLAGDGKMVIVTGSLVLAGDGEMVVTCSDLAEMRKWL